MNQLIKLAVSDFKLIFRDPSLRTFLFMPLMVIGIIVWFLPSLVSKYPVVQDYVPYVLMAGLVQTSTMFGFIYSMVFIDEKDIQIAKVYGILPVSKTAFTTSRLFLPFFLSTFFTVALLLLQPFYSLAIPNILILSALSGLVAPVLALTVSVLSKNKMEGFTWFKLLNLLVTLPLLGFFLPFEFLNWFGVLPTFWAFIGLNDLVFDGNFLLSMSIGFIYLAGLLVFLVKRFSRVHFI